MSDNITAADLEAHRRDSECCTGDCNQGRLCHVTMARLTLRGAVAWRGVDPQALREGRATPAVIGAVNGARQWTGVDHECRLWPAEASTEIGAEPSGRHRDGWITRAWLRFARVLG